MKRNLKKEVRLLPVGWHLLLCCVSLSVLIVAQTSAKDAAKATLPPLLPRVQEMEMALSAAPEHLRKEAAVYVLQRGGYVQARAGTNGFTCLVLREDGGTAPICYDAEGTQTTFRADLRRAELREKGQAEKEADQIIADEYKTGKLLAPRRAGVAYMLSTEFTQHDHKTGKQVQVFPPHVMFYAPYLKNSDIGARPDQRGSQTHPWILNEGTPRAYIIVVLKPQAVR